MKATTWEFKNRALVFGLIFGLAFSLYWLDPQNAAVALANWLEGAGRISAEFTVRVLFACAAILLMAAALIRTWASGYLRADIVYAADIKSASLIADGPYRHVRNPLYFANVLMAIGMGALASRAGFVVVVAMMIVFCYRLILREEAELAANQGRSYELYRAAVPRLWPSLRAHIPTAGAAANWAGGLKAESWYWGFALAVLVFAITLKTKLFFVILGASVLCHWLLSRSLQKKGQSETAGSV